MWDFNEVQPFVEKWEKGIDDNPNDSGGVTKNGICISFLTDFAKTNKDFVESIGLKLPITRQTILNLTKEQETKLFKYAFWDKIPKEITSKTRVALYDASVNCGRKQAAKFLQRACNLNQGNILSVDGIIGKLTIARVVELLDDNFDTTLAKIQTDFREYFYRDLCVQKPSQKVFLKGWLNRINDLRKFLKI